jgi:hypothetical protein
MGQIPLHFDNRIGAQLGRVTGRRGPGPQVSAKLRKRPSLLETERRRIDFVEWKVDRAITIEKQLPLREPEALDGAAIVGVYDRIRLVALNYWISVTPDSEYSAWYQHSTRLAIETGRIEPMERLSDRDDIGRMWGKAAVFRPREPVFDSGISFSLRELRGARVSRNYASESCRKTSRGLAGACRAIPGDAGGRSDFRQPVEQLWRIFRPITRV